MKLSYLSYLLRNVLLLDRREHQLFNVLNVYYKLISSHCEIIYINHQCSIIIAEHFPKYHSVLSTALREHGLLLDQRPRGSFMTNAKA